MSRLTDLLTQVKSADKELGAELEKEFKILSNRRAFGLNFERHKPESVELPDRPVSLGSKVHILPPRDSNKKSDRRLWRVIDISNKGRKKVAHLTAISERKAETKDVELENLAVVAEFRDAIYPGLVSTEKIERGGNKPFHTVINGENFHALEALTFTHRGKIDAIYIDPPYNKPERKDWKYNNNYVDAEDSYRHSKWLAMMERRIRIAKELLNSRKSVLIVTIDEKEYLRLGLLLEQMFPGNRIQMISSNIKPSGSARDKEFYRVDEYIFFVFIGKAAVIDANIQGLCITEADDQSDEEDSTIQKRTKKPKSVRWAYLTRSGSGAQREDSRLKFYPVLVNLKKEKIVGAGEVLVEGKNPNDYVPPKGLFPVWPIRSDKTQGRWQLNTQSFNDLLKQGYIKISSINHDKKKVSLIYLSEDHRRKIESGEIVIVGKDKYGGINVQYTDKNVVAGRPKTQWSSKAHSATDHGSSLLPRFIPKRKFSNPKSLYAVEDTLRFFISDNPKAIVLDFFAGSGTTAHAVMRLNRQDNGMRQSILITNNEVSDKEDKALRKKKLRPGDKSWEKWGIFEHITKPRIKAAVTGKTPEGKRIEGNYKFNDVFPMTEGFIENVEFFKLTYETPISIEHELAFERIAPLLWMRAGAEGKCIDRIPKKKGWEISDTYALLTDLDKAKEFCEAIEKCPIIRIAYIVTDDDNCFQSVAQDLSNKVEVVRLYESYLKNFQFSMEG